MLTIQTAQPARFSEEEMMGRRLTEAWLATGIVPVAHIVADLDTFDDDATCTVPARRPGRPLPSSSFAWSALTPLCNGTGQD